jgi:hypothetical protein
MIKQLLAIVGTYVSLMVFTILVNILVWGALAYGVIVALQHFHIIGG